ncbi:MAG: glycoside hydrolase family protein [Planctomycetota bacterium]|jgi:sucrose-6-phosphate hydrolase SacC (GH32 family)
MNAGKATVLVGTCLLFAESFLLDARADDDFPVELVDFVAHEGNPVFGGTGGATWDKKIRERGYILHEGDVWRLWYTGYNPALSDAKLLGYATSSDGLLWTRHPENPIFDESWVEDVHVVRHGDAYVMVAEGRHDVAHMMTSPDGVHWKDHGSLDVRYTDGKPLTPGPYGTPTLWIEGPTWYLFYERRDEAIWLAKSTDRKVWINISDDPVIPLGPDAYDKHAVALNQIVEHLGRYYAYYHANADPKWRGPWTTNAAVSDDLVHWKKYAKNPVIPTDHSSAILVRDGDSHRLYTMHPDVRVWFPRKPARR